MDFHPLANGKASAFMSFVGYCGAVHFYASTKPKRNVPSVSSVDCQFYTICTFLSQLQGASSLPAWLYTAWLLNYQHPLTRLYFKKKPLWDRANQPTNQEKKKSTFSSHPFYWLRISRIGKITHFPAFSTPSFIKHNLLSLCSFWVVSLNSSSSSKTPWLISVIYLMFHVIRDRCFPEPFEKCRTTKLVRLGTKSEESLHQRRFNTSRVFLKSQSRQCHHGNIAVIAHFYLTFI